MRNVWLLALLTGCGSYPHEFQTPVEGGVHQVETTVIFQSRERVNLACNGYRQTDTTYLACYHPITDTIRAPLAQHANDTEAMCALGHEIYHDLFGTWHGPSWLER